MLDLVLPLCLSTIYSDGCDSILSMIGDTLQINMAERVRL